MGGLLDAGLLGMGVLGGVAGGASDALKPGETLWAAHGSSINFTAEAFTKVMAIRIYAGGTVRVRFGMSSANTSTLVQGQIHINGVPAGLVREASGVETRIYTEDISCKTGDEIQLYTRRVSGDRLGSAENFGLYISLPDYEITL